MISVGFSARRLAGVDDTLMNKAVTAFRVDIGCLYSEPDTWQELFNRSVARLNGMGMDHQIDRLQQRDYSVNSHRSAHAGQIRAAQVSTLKQRRGTSPDISDVLVRGRSSLLIHRSEHEYSGANGRK